MRRHVCVLTLMICVGFGQTRNGFAQEVDFAHDVVPILRTHCAECHTGERSEGGFSLDSQRKVLQSGYVEAGKADSSRLIELVLSADADDQMPPADRKRLTVAEINILKAWVNAGVTWEPGFRFTESGYEPPLLPRSVELPAADFPGQNPIDRLLKPYYQQHQLTAPAKVSDAEFMRRASLDLIGLPPTLEQQLESAAELKQSGREQFVDQLLARNRDYAEHWITFWNDLLRNDYAGTGYIDGGRQQISNWLFLALLNNMPYDQFVRELITPVPGAGGFIAGIKWRGDVNASQVREIQFSQNVSQVFLGINMKCASCHDSFIDRWTLDEAYGLAAIYATRELEIHRCDKPIGRKAKAAWIFPEIGSVDPAAAQPERLRQLADVMTSPQNGRFSRTMVNRLWHRLMGRGIVHPVDAMHTEPWNEDLLDFLANELVANKYDLKHILRLIATSDAYQGQMAAAVDSANSDEYVFRGPVARHITAEQFLDSVRQLTQAGPQPVDAPIPATQYHDNLPQITPQGRWIWAYADTLASPAKEKVAFRLKFEIEQRPTLAGLVITCDNEYKVWLNGKLIKEDKNLGSVELLNLRSRLKDGSNELLIVGQNGGDAPNPAALYAEVVLANGPEDRRHLPSDTTWEMSREIPKPEETDSVTWQPAVIVTDTPMASAGVVDSIQRQTEVACFGPARSMRSSLLRSNMLARSLGRPERAQVVTTRPESLSTLQAIDLANGEALNQLLEAGATRLLPAASHPEALITRLFQEALTREPTEAEQQFVLALLGETPTVESIQDVLWTLVMLPEFQFVQ